MDIMSEKIKLCNKEEILRPYKFDPPIWRSLVFQTYLSFSNDRATTSCLPLIPIHSKSKGNLG